MVRGHTSSLYLSSFDSKKISSIHLKSYLYGYFQSNIELPRSEYDPFQVGSATVRHHFDYQTFTISRDGELKVENKLESRPKSITLESFRTAIDPELASWIIDLTLQILINNTIKDLICDGPLWKMDLTDVDGKKYCCSGCMWADPEYDEMKLSKEIRSLLSSSSANREFSIFDPSRLVLFDGFHDEEADEEE